MKVQNINNLLPNIYFTYFFIIFLKYKILKYYKFKNLKISIFFNIIYKIYEIQISNVIIFLFFLKNTSDSKTHSILYKNN